jgi:hypothetical protein
MAASLPGEPEEEAAAAGGGGRCCWGRRLRSVAAAASEEHRWSVAAGQPRRWQLSDWRVAQPLLRLAAVRVCHPGGLDALRGQTAGLLVHIHSVPLPGPGPARPFHLVSVLRTTTRAGPGYALFAEPAGPPAGGAQGPGVRGWAVLLVRVSHPGHSSHYPSGAMLTSPSPP